MFHFYGVRREGVKAREIGKEPKPKWKLSVSAGTFFGLESKGFTTTFFRNKLKRIREKYGQVKIKLK